MDQTSQLVSPHLVFNGKNYLSWKIRTSKEIELTLKCPKALSPIPENEAAADIPIREEQDAKAAGMIFNRIGDDVIVQVRNCTTARAIFDVLDAHYGHNNVSNAILIQTQLDNMKLDPRGDVQKFFAKLDSLLHSLVDCGVNVTDNERSLRYLRTLPPSMKTIRQGCRSLLPLAAYTSSHVKSTIMQECSDLQTEFEQQHNGNGDNKRKPDHRNTPANRANGNGLVKENGSCNGNGSYNGNGTCNENGSENGNGPGNGFNGSNGSNGSNRATNGSSVDSSSNHKGYQGKNYDVRKATCYRCRDKGHIASNCPNSLSASVNVAAFNPLEDRYDDVEFAS